MLLRQINNIDELKDAATEIAAEISGKNLYLTGALGAGKTTLTKLILSEMGVNPRTVKSPTYTIKRTYNSNNGIIHHLDLYRLEEIDLNEIITTNETHIIEWADKIPNHEKLEGIHLYITINQDDSRTIKILNVQAQ